MRKTTRRRTLCDVAMFCAIAVACTLTRAQKPASTDLKPYVEVPSIRGDEKTIRVFLSPSCPFSRSYLQFFKNLQGTLPLDRTLKFTPLVNQVDGVEFAMAFSAIERFYPSHLANFIEASMIAVQDLQIHTSSWTDLDRIAKSIHLPSSVSSLVFGNKSSTIRSVETMIALRQSAQVVLTPSVLVVGKYTLNPEFTQGDAQLFSQLLNGLISMAK